MSLTTIYLLSLLGLASLFFGGRWVWRASQEHRRRKLYQQPLKPEWLAFLQKEIPLYAQLPENLKPILQGHVNYFLHSKHILGRGGQKVDDRIRLTIAANACLLVLARKEPIFPGFKTILVYPETYRAAEKHYDGHIVTHHHSARAGESWHRGPVILAWSDVLTGNQNPDDGHNVVIHEFAHKLDEENHLMDGLPVLRDSEQYRAWASVLNREYDAFLQRVERGDNRVIDSYGAQSPVEFFAVISEAFFEKPVLMQEKLPELYQQLSHYYGVDTAKWQ